MTTQETITINDWGGAAVQIRRRTNNSGVTKDRLTIDYKSEALSIIMDPRALTKAPCEVAAEVIKEQIRAIAEDADDDTKRRRVSAERILSGAPNNSGRRRNGQWARERYSGGRLGLKMPNTKRGGKLFNDSGRFADGIVMGPTPDGWTINVAANRLDRSTFSDADFQRNIIDNLRRLVPAIGDPASLGDNPDVRVAITEATIGALRKEGKRNLSSLLAEARNLAQNTAELGQAVGEFAGEQAE